MEADMWNNEWRASEASKKAKEFQDEQKRLHAEKLAQRKAERDARRKAAKVTPPVEYPWMKDQEG
jgi:hypothetical protein